jgi:lysophospholipase L1-like esterase
MRQKIIIALTSVILLLCGFEGAVRFILGIQPAPPKFLLSPTLGWQWNPHYDAVTNYHGDEYRTIVSSQGLRNEVITIPKPPNVIRIIALGDSITEGGGVALENTFVKILEEFLQNEAPTQTIEVINAGTGDYGTEQELIWLRERGLHYQPDLVMVNVYLNDSRSFEPPSQTVATFHNFFVERSAFYYLSFHSIRWSLATQEIQSPDFRFRHDDEWTSKVWISNSEALTHLIQEADQDWGLAWQENELKTIETNLSRMLKLGQRYDFKLMLVFFPVDVQVYAQVDTPLNLDYPQQHLLKFAQANNIPSLDLLPVLRTQQTTDLFYDQVHLKPDTHRLVAEAIYMAIRANDVLFSNIVKVPLSE